MLTKFYIFQCGSDSKVITTGWTTGVPFPPELLVIAYTMFFSLG